MGSSRPLGTNMNAIIWQSFFVPTLPFDAVIQGMYPTAVVSQHCDSTFHDGASGPNTVFGGLGGHFAGETGHMSFPSTLTCTTQTNAEYWDASVGTSLTLIPPMRIGIGLSQSLFLDNITDTISASGIGVAIYYTSATPTIDPLMPPPFAVPAGQGLAWAVPSSLFTTGTVTDTGTANGVPATSNSTRKAVGGLINYPNGNGFNGSLRVTVPNGTIKNICSTPYQVVPRFTSTFKVVNGFVQFGSATLLSNDCLLPRYVYNVELDDTANNLKYLDNWYLPQNSDLAYGIGDLQAENFGGPITIAVPKGIIQNPTQNQVIDQPDGTSLNLVGTILINGVPFATRAGGVTYVGLVQTNPTTSQIITQPGGTFINFIGDVRVNGTTFGSGVTSFNGRSGAVAPTTGDYACTQITGAVCSLGTLHYQIIQSNASDQPAEPKLNFSTDFSVSDNSGVATNTALTNIVSGGVYAFPSSITVTSTGRISSITAGGTPTTCNSNGCYRQDAGGIYEMWGLSTASGTGSNQGTGSITFPHAFTSTTNLILAAWPDNCASSGCSGQSSIAVNLIGGSLTTSGASVHFSAPIVIGGGGSNINTTVHAMWHALGQ